MFDYILDYRLPFDLMIKPEDLDIPKKLKLKFVPYSLRKRFILHIVNQYVMNAEVFDYELPSIDRLVKDFRRSALVAGEPYYETKGPLFLNFQKKLAADDFYDKYYDPLLIDIREICDFYNLTHVINKEELYKKIALLPFKEIRT